MIEYIQLAFPMLVLLYGVIWVLCNMYRNQMPPLRCLFESVIGMIRYNIPGCSYWMKERHWSVTWCWERPKKRGLPTLPILGDSRNNRFHLLYIPAMPQVGVRFNPYKWPEGHGMADDVGKRLLHGLKLRGCGMWDEMAATRYFHLIYMIYFDESTTV